MTANGTSPPNPWEAIGLPSSWQPSPLSWELAKIDAVGPAGQLTYHVLILNTITGRVAYVFDDEAVARLRDALTNALSGLQVVRQLPPTGPGPF